MTARRSQATYLPSPPSSSDSGSIRRVSRTSPNSHRDVDALPLDEDAIFDKHLAEFLTIKTQPFAVSGHIPFESREFSLFFRTRNGTTHSVDFPLDPEDRSSAAFEILLETCKVYTAANSSSALRNSPSQRSSSIVNPYSAPRKVTRGPYMFPPNVPLTTTFDIASHPILETAKNVLYPNLPPGYYLTTEQPALEITTPGSQPTPLVEQVRPPQTVAFVVVTLPVRFKGGALVICHPEDDKSTPERCRSRGGKPGQLDWTAFLADSDHYVEPIEKGCRVTLKYPITLQKLGPSTGLDDSMPLILSNDRFLDAMTPLFARAKSARLGFFLAGSYSVSPSDMAAETLSPQLRGGDALLFNAAQLYGFSVEFRYAAGGYIWPEQATIQLSPEQGLTSPSSSNSSTSSLREDTKGRTRDRKLSISKTVRFADEVETEDSFRENTSELQDNVKCQVLASGALTLAHAGVHALIAPNRKMQGPVTRLPLSFISDGNLATMWVNVLMVMWRA